MIDKRVGRGEGGKGQRGGEDKRERETAQMRCQKGKKQRGLH